MISNLERSKIYENCIFHRSKPGLDVTGTEVITGHETRITPFESSSFFAAIYK